MILQNTSIQRTSRSGTDNVALIGGQNLKIETSPDGKEILNVVVPEGKAWSVSISVNISESDA